MKARAKRWGWWVLGGLALLWALSIPLRQQLGLEWWNERRREWSFPLEGAQEVEVHAWQADQLVMKTGPAGVVQITAIPRLRPAGYHAPEPVANNVPGAQEHAFTWQVARRGEMLVLTAKGEERHAHHRYQLESLEVSVPAGMRLVGVRQELAAATPAPK